MLVGVACLNLVAAALLVEVLRRLEGEGAALWGTAAMLGVIVLRPDVFVSPWNPYLAMLPFALAIVAAWAASCGHTLALPVLVGAGSFAVQTHVAYAPLVVATMLWGLGWLGWRLRGAERRGGLWLPLLSSLGIVVVAWAPVVWDQVAGSGNLGRLLRYFGRSDRSVVGVQWAFSVAADLLTPWGLFAILQNPPLLVRKASALMLLVPLAGTGLGLLVALRAGMGSVAMLMGLITTLLLVSIAAVASIDGAPWMYLFVWLWVVGLVLWSALFGLVGRLLASRADGGMRRLPGGALIAIACLAAVASMRIAAVPFDQPIESRAIDVLAAAAVRSLPPGTAVSIRQVGGWPAIWSGVAVELVKAGHPLIVPPQHGSRCGEHRTGDPRASPNQLMVAVGAKAISGLDARRDFTRLALFDPGEGIGDGALPGIGDGALLGGALGRWLRPTGMPPVRTGPAAIFVARN